MMYDFFAGFGLSTFLIFGWQVVYELVRHRSMLEYPYPDIPREFVIFSGIGFVMWIACSVFAGAP